MKLLLTTLFFLLSIGNIFAQEDSLLIQEKPQIPKATFNTLDQKYMPIYPGCDNVEVSLRKTCLDKKINKEVQKAIHPDFDAIAGETTRVRCKILFTIDSLGIIEYVNLEKQTRLKNDIFYQGVVSDFKKFARRLNAKTKLGTGITIEKDENGEVPFKKIPFHIPIRFVLVD